MGEVHYMISEAARRVNVEAHVLRYWEEELELPIERTELGHRYYTEENIQLFHCIKNLKEQGMLLKELKEIIPDLLKTKAKVKKQEIVKAVPEVVEKQELKGEENPKEVQDKLAKVQEVFQSFMKTALEENNQVLEKAVGDYVSEKVIKEMDYLMQAKERQEEERFQKLDHLIRQQQTLRKESARFGAGKRLKKMLGTSWT